ncbi:nucleolar protein 6 isoform X2 [Phalaenopsis equestris]|uniref:nucleolar protein 6 isoform X2 n=1 Tax=Phalaenopsis equestris TaxID=78828 RepID=UPI0009E302CE|nr:nucleolar protein 6 isoform X2 [Phalaenopsis equestris]
MVPETESMDFKVGELLKDLQLDPSASNAIDRALSSIIDYINNIPVQEARAEYAAGFLRDLRVPSDKVNFIFKSPEAIRIAGSYSIGCVAKPDVNVDLLIRMPKECFHEKDYLNYRYHAKRCIYLCVVEKSLKSSPLVRKIEWRTFRNEARKPVIHLYPVIKHAELSEFFIRIIPTASSVFDGSRLSISRNNVRAFNQSDTSRATPYYNSSILEDMFMEENADFVKNTFNGWNSLGDALLLLKVWARNRTSIYTHDCLNGYLISIILSYLAGGPGGNHINKSMKAMLIFRVTLKFISSNLLAKGLSLRPLTQSKPSNEEMMNWLKAFPTVLYDATGHANLLFCLTKTAFAELQDEAAWTVNCIDKCRGGEFEEIFMTKVDFAAKFDACLRINFKGNSIVNSFDFCLDDERWGLVEKHVQSVLQQGLSDRAKLIRVIWGSAPSNWSIKEGFENFGKEPMLVGFLLNSEEKCFRVVDIGPHAENKEEAANFRKFWGEKAELRRFKDGTIAESTVWECAPWQRHLIMKRITEYVISKHFILPKEDILYVVDQLDFSLHLGGKDPISSSTSLLEAFETLSKRLRLLEDVPLRISSVQPLDAAFRQSAVFPPEPHPLIYEKGIAKTLPKFTTTCIKPLTVMIQLEGSGNWPSDAAVIEKTKVAFLLKICESLQARWGMLCSATESEVNVLVEGYAFSLKILHERSLHLLGNQAGNDIIKSKRYIDEELFLRSQHSSMINGLNGRYPAYGSVVRLAKRWVSSHLFSSFVEEEAIELIVAYLFLRPFPFHAPLSRITGFLRFLRLTSNYDWTFSPLIIDLNEDFIPQDEWEINENFLSCRKSSEENMQNLERAMFLATTYDKTSKAWTKCLPNVETLRRMAAYARSSADLLTKLILQGQNGPCTWEGNM